MKKKYFQNKILFVSLALYFILMAVGMWRVFIMLKVHIPGISIFIYTGVYLLFSTALPLGFFLPHSRVSKILDVLGNYWICFQITFFIAAIFDWLIQLLIVNLLNMFTAAQFAYFSLLLFSLTAIVTVYGIIYARIVHLTQYECKIEKPCLQGETLRIIHLSDLHLGCINDLNAIKKIVKRVNDLSADLICISGDTFTENVRDVFDLPEIAAALSSLKCRYGVYACLGNHDCGSELSQMLSFFQQAKIQLLCDEYIYIDQIVLLGRSDMTPGGKPQKNRMSIEACLKGADLKKLVMVMDHQPGDIENSMKAGVDILLSGHTHGGQFFPIHRMVKRIFPHYVGGKKYGTMYSIISSGTCTAIPPIRIGSRSEIVEIIVS